MKSKLISEPKACDKIKSLLEEVPGQSVKELAAKLGENRTFISGYLKALEDLGHVTSRPIGPARVYYKETKETPTNKNAESSEGGG